MSRLNQYKKEMEKVGASVSWHEYLEADYAATNGCLKDIIAIAKSDVGSSRTGITIRFRSKGR